MEKQRKKFYITTPIYYVNDKPSVGHAYTTIISDILARWHRLKDEDVFFLTGLDENSQKTVQASIKLGFNDVKKFADYMATQWIEVWKKLNISNNDFIRTTEERHEKLVKDFIERVNKKKDIYKGKYSGLYCEGFVNEDDLINGLCPYHQKAPKQIEEENYFFKLSKYQDKILKYIETKKDFIQPESRKNEILNFVKNGLKDISVSRQSMLWGIPFPNDEKHKVYVWFDALTNYLHPKEFWPANIHIIGKDIIKFHCIIWPAMLMSAEYKLPKTLFVHGFLTINGQKMGKSLGNAIDPLKLSEKYGVDQLLIKAGKKGTILSGISAGAICWFKYGLSDSKRFINKKNDFVLMRISGLGIISCTASPHHIREKEKRDSGLVTIMRKTNGVGLAIDDNTALLVQGDKYKVLTSKPGTNIIKVYYRKNKIERLKIPHKGMLNDLISY